MHTAGNGIHMTESTLGGHIPGFAQIRNLKSLVSCWLKCAARKHHKGGPTLPINRFR